jgi:predicted DNA binding protein
MRKMVLELSESEISKLPNSPLRNVKSNEFLHILRFDEKEFAAIIRIEFREQAINIDELLACSGLTNTKVELLERDKQNRLTFFVKGQLPKNTKQQKLASFGGYLLTPLEIVDGKIRITFVGKPKQLKALLKTCEDIGLQYRVMLLSDAKFASTSPISNLTPKQKKVIIAAFKEGYYDIPRKIESRELSAKLGLKSSAFIEHRRKAERRLIGSMLNE